ncbi:MAG: LamG domain-containing protein [Candidatus Aenigmarchaeota archaeon]|nr:LamG domain-containing protein [Candidatus Aenigmarchaeota archaeon]
MKGITPVIALVMLVLITVGIVGTAYSWFSGLLSSQTKKAISIPSGGAYCSNSEIKVYALNNGDTTLAGSDILVAQVDGVDVSNTPFFGDMNSGLIGYWMLDETSGLAASDSSGNGNNGNLNNMEPADWVNGKIRNALNFDGVDEFVKAPNPPTFSNALTITFWVRRDGPITIGSGIGYGKGVDSPPNYGWLVHGDNDKFYLLISDGASTSSSPMTDPIADNVWTHVTAVYSGNSLRMYLNGVSKNSNPTALTEINDASSSGIEIGKDVRYGSGRFFKGSIDDVKVYNKVAGNVNIPSGASGLVINYPGTTGRHNIRIGTSSSVAETSVICT